MWSPAVMPRLPHGRGVPVSLFWFPLWSVCVLADILFSFLCLLGWEVKVAFCLHWAVNVVFSLQWTGQYWTTAPCLAFQCQFSPLFIFRKIPTFLALWRDTRLLFILDHCLHLKGRVDEHGASPFKTKPGYTRMIRKKISFCQKGVNLGWRDSGYFLTKDLRKYL